MKRLAVVALAALVAASCGGSDSGGPRGYLAKASNGAAFIQWTRSEDSVTGSLTLARREQSGDNRESVEKDNVAFTGIISGSNITLTLVQGLGFSTNWNGTLKDDDLTLSYASEDGDLVTLEFKPADVSSYNEAVADLQDSVAAANRSQARIDAEAEAAQATDNASAAVMQDLSDLGEHLRAAKADLATVPASLRAEQKAVARTYAALQTTLAAGPDDVCYEAGGVDYEAGGVEYEKGGVESELDGVNSDLSVVDEHLGRLRSDFRTLQSALAALPDYRPEGLPTEAEVADARAEAQASVANIVRTGRAYRRRANAMVQTAQTYSARAQRACDAA